MVAPEEPQKKSSYFLVAVIVVAISIVASYRFKPFEEGVLVPGFGFSGFWWTFGRLCSMEEAEFDESEYFCFSAGCLAIVAKFTNSGFDRVLNSTLDKQQAWKEGTLDRYKVVEAFVDDLIESKMSCIDDSNEGETLHGNEWLDRVNVITTTRYGITKVSKASDLASLKELLIKSSFIPFATGSGISAGGELDGGFSFMLPWFPRFSANIFPNSVRVLKNMLNINMGEKEAVALYQLGLAGGDQRRRRQQQQQEEQQQHYHPAYGAAEY